MVQYEYQAYRLWTYDLWSDGEVGLMVNDRFDRGIVVIQVECETGPTEDVLSNAIGAPTSAGLSWDGDSDFALYASDDNGDPACELVRLAGPEHDEAICDHLLNPVNFPR